jgi:hypothetical protein
MAIRRLYLHGATFSYDNEMPRSSRRIGFILSLLIAAAVGIGIVLLLGNHPEPAPAPPTTQPAMVTTIPSSPAPAPVVASMQTYAQLLADDFPDNPPGAPLAATLDLSDAAHLILPQRVYLCPRGDLWLAHPGADPLPNVLARAANETEHIADRDVQYVLWTMNSRGDQEARAVCRTADGYELVSATGSQPMPSRPDFNWSGAMDWDDNGTTRLIVPTTDGIDVITVDKTLTESYCPLRSSGSGPAPQMLFDLRGILAWIPADDAVHTNTTAARFVDGAWTKLDPSNWPGSIIHLVPMLDGTVLQIRRGDNPQSVDLVLEPLDSPSIDENQIDSLVDQLDDPDPDKRTEAFEKLTQYGPGIYPILQKVRPNASPIAGPRIDQILASASQTTLGGMEIQDNLLTLTARLSDSGAVFFAPHGVLLDREKGPPQEINPAYLVVRPGRYIQLLPTGLANFVDEQTRLSAFKDDWIAAKPNLGISRFLPPDQLTPLLRPSEQKFTRWVGIDSHGRWIFQPQDSQEPTLILDPTVPDPSPRLAIWTIHSGDEVGWNSAGWPVVMRNSRWILTDHDWELLPHGDAMNRDVPPQSNTLWVDSHGNRYLDGRSTLTVVHPGSQQDVVWNIPQDMAGSDGFQPWLVQVASGRLLLFNANGQIIRLRPAGSGFTVEAVFNRRMGFLRSIHRVWIDPAGRVDVSYGDHFLAIIFPDGRVDPAIADQILPEDLKHIDPN